MNNNSDKGFVNDIQDVSLDELTAVSGGRNAPPLRESEERDELIRIKEEKEHEYKERKKKKNERYL